MNIADIQVKKDSLSANGFVIVDHLYSHEEVNEMIRVINKTPAEKDTFRKSADLFAIRQFLKEVPQMAELILHKKLKNLVEEFFGHDYFVVKSIYFDKPGSSNWYVAYHQDLTISVDKKTAIEGFGPWTVKQNQFAVQPPVSILKNNFTIRIHLDDTDENNGALRVIPGSHVDICRPETINLSIQKEATCNVLKGGVMIMRPLLLHRSARTTNQKKRRVVHIEFSNQPLPAPLQWSEKMPW